MTVSSRWQRVSHALSCQPLSRAIQHSFLTHIPESKRALLSSEQPLYLACSGGRDSMALLYGCWLLGLPIHVIHINHQLQPISDSWQQQVEHFCQQLQIPCDSVRLRWSVPVATINEQMARTARYQAILSVTGENAIVALAHHADDQLETVLMNLCQGTGLAGLAGMRAFRLQAEFETPAWLWRPLLSLSRQTISEVVIACELPYVDDPTNVGEHNQRAFLRQHILPKLHQRFNSLSDNVHRTTQNLQEAQHVLTLYQEQCQQACSVAAWSPYQQALDIATLRSLAREARFLLLHHWVKGEEKFAPKRHLIEQIEGLLTQPASDYTAILAWQGHQIRRYRHTLYRLDEGLVCLLSAVSHRSQHSAIQTTNIPWQGHFPLTLLRVEKYQLQLVDSPRLLETKVAVVAHTAILEENLTLRPVRLGEKFRLKGKTYQQSFKKICQAYAITPWERQLAWVLELAINKLEPTAVALILPNHCLLIQYDSAEVAHLHNDSFYPNKDIATWLSHLSLQIVALPFG